MAAPLQFIFPSCKLNSESFGDGIRRKHHGITRQKFLEKHQKCIVSGEHGSGKTALLFQCAVSLAQRGCHVTFITPTKFQSLPPAVEGAITPDPLLMKQINIMYFQDRPTLIQYLSKLHTTKPLPHAIIIDNIDYYATHPQTSELASVVSVMCAYLVDAVTYIANKRSDSDDDGDADDCFLLASISCSSQGDYQVPHVYRHFLTSELHITSMNGCTSTCKHEDKAGQVDMKNKKRKKFKQA
ncbi:uncharacterized protein LOC121406018 isoform X2 [Lytechinus variegatus]|uniref:uncharacterized protein LOC121406018 isoform X2 n=1 Tax=Lytechinus variegatus TaxID=7654 RepID=UPI001BB23534|nr:uncharacterized protein LOC121406018 isoform X2 [Lytechinus variegatus]